MSFTYATTGPFASVTVPASNALGSQNLSVNHSPSLGPYITIPASGNNMVDTKIYGFQGALGLGFQLP